MSWIAVVAGLAALAWALSGGASRPSRAPRAPAAPARAAAAPPAPRGPQVTVLGGPVRTDAGDWRGLGVVTQQRDLDASRRAAALSEVLDRADGSPVWVEGIDGPSGR